MDVIRLWVIGDAEHYLRFEGDQGTCLIDRGRLVGETTPAQGAALTVGATSQARETLRAPQTSPASVPASCLSPGPARLAQTSEVPFGHGRWKKDPQIGG